MHKDETDVSKTKIVAVATVIQVQAPTSAQPGDKALLSSEGVVEGWVGGGCVQPAVQFASAQVLRTGKPCLLRVAPSGEWQAVEGLTDYASSCLGKGGLLIFIEPLFEQPHLCVLGDSAVARSLVEQAVHMNLNVSLHGSSVNTESLSTRIDIQATLKCSGADFIVIATQGTGDKRAIAAALESDCAHIRMVVSARKLAALKTQLHQDGVSESELTRLHGPAGIPIGAQIPQEIALSVLAEIVQLRRANKLGQKSASEFAQLTPVDTTKANDIVGHRGCCDE